MAVVCVDGFQKANNAVTEGNAQIQNNHDISRFLFSSETHYFIRNSRTLVPVPSRVKPFFTVVICAFKTRSLLS